MPSDGPAQTEVKPVQRIWDNAHEVARLLLIGEKPVDIASKLGLSPGTIYEMRKGSVFQEHMTELRRKRDAEAINVARELRDLCPTALGVLKERMKSQSEHISLRAALEVLDRAGHSKVQRIDSRHSHAVLTVEDIERLKDRAQSALPTLVDVTPNVVEAQDDANDT